MDDKKMPKPTRVDDDTVEFLGIRFVSVPAEPPSPEVVAKPAQKANVKIDLRGEGGNVYAVIASCLVAAKQSSYTAEQINAFKEEATRTDYEDVLKTCDEWFNVRWLGR